MAEAETVKKELKVTELRGITYFKNERRIIPDQDFALNDSLITQITSSVNPDRVRFFIQSLQDFQTRFLYAETRDSVASWIKYQFMKMGSFEI